VSGAIVPLAQALDAARFGGKAAGLAGAIAHSLPVPDGFALDADLAERAARRDARVRDAIADVVASLHGAPLAVRSSAVGEDGASASFAGQHITKLGAASLEQVIDAIAEVHASANTAGARAYRARMNLPTDVRMGVVVQRMVDARCAGVLFTRNPLGGDERMIEASWGLGEVVVSGRVVPDRYRLARGGALLESEPSDKDVEIVLRADGGTVERTVPHHRRAVRCLDADMLAALERLAANCDAAFGSPSDIEWAFEGARLLLLQRRPVTRTHGTEA
jgi:pyruvate,water dikinase